MAPRNTDVQHSTTAFAAALYPNIAQENLFDAMLAAAVSTRDDDIVIGVLELHGEYHAGRIEEAGRREPDATEREDAYVRDLLRIYWYALPDAFLDENPTRGTNLRLSTLTRAKAWVLEELAKNADCSSDVVRAIFSLFRYLLTISVEGQSFYSNGVHELNPHDYARAKVWFVSSDEQKALLEFAKAHFHPSQTLLEEFLFIPNLPRDLEQHLMARYLKVIGAFGLRQAIIDRRTMNAYTPVADYARDTFEQRSSAADAFVAKWLAKGRECDLAWEALVSRMLSPQERGSMEIGRSEYVPGTLEPVRINEHGISFTLALPDGASPQLGDDIVGRIRRHAEAWIASDERYGKLYAYFVVTGGTDPAYRQEEQVGGRKLP